MLWGTKPAGKHAENCLLFAVQVEGWLEYGAGGVCAALALLNIFISDLGSGIWRRHIAAVNNTKLRGAVSALREQEKD